MTTHIVHAGTLLRAARTSRGIPQWVIAKNAHINASRLSALELGKEQISPGEAARLAFALKLNVQVLLRKPRRMTVSSWQRTQVRTFREILATCSCGWVRLVDGSWVHVQAELDCPHHAAQEAVQ